MSEGSVSPDHPLRFGDHALWFARKSY